MTNKKSNSNKGNQRKSTLRTLSTCTHYVVAPTADPSVGGFLGNVLVGQDQIYTTGFAHGKDIHTIIDEWISMVEQWTRENEIPGLLEFEKDMAAKVGPLSVRVPWKDRVSSLEDYYTDASFNEDHINPIAMDNMIKEWSVLSGLLLRSQGRVVENMPLSTNSGLPFFTKRRRFAEAHYYPVRIMRLNGVRAYDHILYSNLPKDSDFYQVCALPGWRGQEGGPNATDVKQRMVWMFPMAVNILEGQFYQPYIEACQHTGLVPAWISSAEVEKRMTMLFDSKGDNYVIGTDFSKFDQHFNSTMAKMALYVYDSIAEQDDNYYSWRQEVFPVKFRIPMLLPTDFDDRTCRISVGLHGMASGSGGTNADETTAHRCLQYHAAAQQGAVLNPHSMCNGDDGIITYPGVDVDQVVKTYTDFGQEMNVDKQHVSRDDAIYLKKYYHTKYRFGGVMAGVYSGARVLGKLKYTERDISDLSDKEYVLRELSILENANAHPLFNQLMRIALTNSKLQLGLKLDGGLDSLVAWVDHLPMEERTKFMNYNQAQQKQFGLKTWRTFMWLKSHASR